MDWLNESLASGVMVSDGAYTLELNFDATGLTPAFYRSSLLFRSRFGDIAIPVILKVKTAGSTPAGTAALTIAYLQSFKDLDASQAGAALLAYDPERQYVLVTNRKANSLDVLDLKNVKTTGLSLVKRIPLGAFGSYGATGVATRDGLIAVSMPASNKTDPGQVLFFHGIDAPAPVGVAVGALPGMLTFTPDGKKLLVSNKGEPNHYTTADPLNDPVINPKGSLSIIDLSHGTGSAAVVHLTFDAFTAGQLDPKIRIFGPNASIAQDLEPGSISVSADGLQAWVTLQGNNAFAYVDLAAEEITKLTALGFKDWSRTVGLDASDTDSRIDITNWPVYGIYMPDALASYLVNGIPYLVTANEGDARDYSGVRAADFNEEIRISEVRLDPTVFPDAAILQSDAMLGRLKVTRAGSNIDAPYTADPDNDGDMDALYTFGGRSFAIWNGQTGSLVFDSGDAFERIVAERFPAQFNIDPGSTSADVRSPVKGPEPEMVTLMPLRGQTYALISLERSAGGFMVYHISDPTAPVFVTYAPSTQGNLRPEGIQFIPAVESPTGNPLVVLAHEGSGSIAVYEVQQPPLQYFMPWVIR